VTGRRVLIVCVVLCAVALVVVVVVCLAYLIGLAALYRVTRRGPLTTPSTHRAPPLR
jgi:hypothetical protein